MVEMRLADVRVSLPTNNPVVLLEEMEGGRTLFIFIGNPEADAIVKAMRGSVPPRPLTHDLFRDVLGAIGAEVERVVVTELRMDSEGNGTFFAELHLTLDGKQIVVSSRPSDAIALAVRYEDTVPIFADEAVLDEAGVLFENDEEEEQIEQFREFLDQVRPEDFAQ